MNWNDLKTYSIKKYYPALVLERLFPRSILFTTEFILRSIVVLGFVASCIVLILPASFIPVFVEFLILGVACIATSLWLIAFALVAFHHSFYFSDMSDGESDFVAPLVNYELARTIYRSDARDVLQSFLGSHIGKLVTLRLGISPKALGNFLAGRTAVLTAEDVSLIAQTDGLSSTNYASALYEEDKEFAHFLTTQGIAKKDLLATTDWVIEREDSYKRKRRFWARTRLGRIPGIGKNWSYGQIFDLEEYSSYLPETIDSDYETHSVYGTEELKELETVLMRQTQANALLISDDKSGALDIVSRLNLMIEEGTAFPEIQHKRIILFNTDLLISKTKTKGAFESEIIKIMNEASYAGNIILVIADMPSFIISAQGIGSDIVSFLDRYFTSGSLQIIALSDVGRFHSLIEPNVELMQRFEKIVIKEVDSENTIHVLQNEIIGIERTSGVLFTYPALKTIAESAERYFPDGIMPDKAIDLLQEIAPQIVRRGDVIVHKEDVLALVQTKTGIPVGEVGATEKDKLINLETILHQRIIGQDEAVNAIASAVRRARSGINNPNRPLGSFLFLGPTGVGKTETTKALANVFFGAESVILRLDMSEYSGADAISKLIGSYEGGKTGVLSTMLREHPYGVLLLDEFEKTTSEVMNLFLQILDEGVFSDMTGKKVSARNLLIVATSNAGSDLIWEAVKKGDDLSHAKELIIDSIIHAQIFKPELLNRFDGVIIFHPLAADHLSKIARIQLENLKKRLATRGINLLITDDLVNYVIASGTDPKFGARPMNRAIQDKVEQIIAEKMIRGDIVPGSEVSLATADFKR